MMSLFLNIGGPNEAIQNAIIGAAGPTGVVLLTVWWFLAHIKDLGAQNHARDLERDKTFREAMEGLIERVDKMETENRNAHRETASKFAAAVGEFQTEYRRTVDGLIQVHKESGSTTAVISGRVSDLGQQVGTLGQQVGSLGDKVDGLGHQIGDLRHEVARKADRAEGERPPPRNKPNQ